MQTAPKFTITERPNSGISYPIFCLISVLVWFAGTLAMRLGGHLFFIPSNSLNMIASFLFLLIVMPILVVVILRWLGIKPEQTYEAIIALIVPSMFLDAIATYYFSQLFPNFDPSTAGFFASWLFWGYAICLITGLVLSKGTQVKRV